MRTDIDCKLYCNIDGKLVLFCKLPCAKCKWRYDLHCPKCDWNKDGKYNTYGGEMMTSEEAERRNKDGKRT